MGRPIVPVGFVVRAFTKQDLDQVASIEAAVAVDPWSRDLFASEFDVATNRRLWFVAERIVPVEGEAVAIGTGANEQRKLVGFGGAMSATDEAHIMNMGVLASDQRRGVARSLLARLLLESVDRGCTAATLEVRASNTPAIGLYESFGFVSVGNRPGYYQDGEDATIMWAHRIYSSEYTRMLTTAKGAT